MVQWLKDHSKKMEAEADFPKINSQMLEMVEKEQCIKMGYDVAKNDNRLPK